MHLCQSLTPFSDFVRNYAGYKVKHRVHFLTFSLLMCHSQVTPLSIFWLQHRWPIVICLQSLTVKVSDVWYYSRMWLHRDFTFLLLVFFYSAAHVESEWNLFSAITQAGHVAFCFCLSCKSNLANRGGTGFYSGSHFISRTVNEVPAFSPAPPH